MRAAFVQNIMDPECGQAKHLDDAADDAADRGPWGVLLVLSGGLTCTGPHNVNSHCTDCRTSPSHLFRPGRWEGVVCPYRAARRTGWRRGHDD